jgi:GNAT superfamily N-acetyltransferase
MPDLLVPLYSLPSLHDKLALLEQEHGVIIRRAHPFERSRIRRFIATHFTEGWADEAEACFGAPPITCYIAVLVAEKKCLGFACVESTARGFFGPTGVDPAYRGRGIGSALLIAALYGLKESGYAYGIIGAAGPVAFYEKEVGAVVIPNSSPGVYVNMLGKDGEEGTR